jgi:hypothetical protein
MVTWLFLGRYLEGAIEAYIRANGLEVFNPPKDTREDN